MEDETKIPESSPTQISSWMNKKIGVATLVIIVISGVMYLNKFWGQSTKNLQGKKLETSGDLISTEGIHWHPELTITIKGEKQVIPSDIGMGMQFAGYPQYDPMMMMTNMHTHDDSGQLHWEAMNGPVKKGDVKLSQFFAIWGKKFTNSCIFDYCNGPQGRLIFKVNGQDNQDFDNYLVKDKDRIEIIFQ